MNIEEIKKVIRPGDVANIRRFHPLKNFEDFKVNVAIGIIKIDQMCVFGFPSDWLDHHTMIYFDDEHTFSVEPPRPKWKKLEEFAGEEVSIFRWNLIRELKDTDVNLLFEGAEEIIKEGAGYDIGQLVDFLISSVAGYPFDAKINWFDEGKKKLVCSVGTASVFAQFRHKLFEMTGEDLPQPFKVLNPKAWSQKFQDKFNKEGHWDINRTFPALYANCATHFQNDYRLIDSFDKDGKRIG